MAKRKSSLPLVIGLGAILVALFYFQGSAIIDRPECKFDSDCKPGQVCSMDGVCIYPAIVPGRQRDNFCPDNSYPRGAYDPDCPMYCPATYERAGGVTMCCLNREGTITVDCDTGVPLNLFPEVTFGKPEQRPSQEWYNMVTGMQAMVSFVPTGTSQSFQYADQLITMSVGITTGKLPSGSIGYGIWLDEVTTKSRTTGDSEPVMTQAWEDCQTAEGEPCIGKAGAFDLGGEQTVPSVWVTPPIDANQIVIGDYLFKLGYCGQALPEELDIPPRCPPALEYDLDLGESELDFGVLVGMTI